MWAFSEAWESLVIPDIIAVDNLLDGVVIIREKKHILWIIKLPWVD